MLDRELSDALIHDVLTPARTVLGTAAPLAIPTPRSCSQSVCMHLSPSEHATVCLGLKTWLLL